VLLVECDTERRAELSATLQAQGLPVLAVSRIAEIERWPVGEVVVTESRRFTPWWKASGALHVVVLADTEEEGIDAHVRGACAWLPRRCSPARLVAVLTDLGVLAPALSGQIER
jgi:hypothetical protein